MNYKSIEDEFNSSIPYHSNIPWFCFPPNFARVLFSISLRNSQSAVYENLGLIDCIMWNDVEVANGSGQYHFRYKRLAYWWNYKACIVVALVILHRQSLPWSLAPARKILQELCIFPTQTLKAERKKHKRNWSELPFTFSADNFRCSVRFRCTLSILVNSLSITPSHPRYFTYCGTPLCMLRSGTRETKQQLPQSLFCKQNSSHLDFLCMGILLNFLVH